MEGTSLLHQLHTTWVKAGVGYEEGRGYTAVGVNSALQATNPLCIYQCLIISF